MRSIPVTGLSLIATLAASDAVACFDPSSQQIMLFREIPVSVEAPFVARVTVVETVETPRNRGLAQYKGVPPISYEGIGRVDRLIKGTISARLIKLVALDSSCDQPLHLGQSGYVVGRLLFHADKLPEFEVGFTEPVGGGSLRRGVLP